MKLDYDLLAQDYARHRQVQPAVLQNLVEAAGLDPASQVLEVGCGTGNYIIAIAQAAGCPCWGCEPSAQMLARAQERPSGVRFQPGRAEQLDYPAGSFDLVFSVDVIHHVVDRPAYFQEAWRVLKPGGRVCTVTDSEDIIRRRQPLAVYFPETVAMELERYPRIADLRAMMAAAGFTRLQDVLAEFPYDLDDIQIYRRKAFSSLHLIPEAAFERGLQRMEADLRGGPIACVSRYLLLWGEKPAG